MFAELRPQDRALLMELLSQELEELGTEIHHTDDRGYRDELKQRRQLVRDLMERLRPMQPA